MLQHLRRVRIGPRGPRGVASLDEQKKKKKELTQFVFRAAERRTATGGGWGLQAGPRGGAAFWSPASRAAAARIVWGLLPRRA